MDANKMHREKATWEQRKNTIDRFEHILALYQATAVRPPNSHLKNVLVIQRRHVGHC